MDSIFNDANEVKPKYNNLRWGKVGDWFKGTLVDNSRRMRNQLSDKGEDQTVFEFRAHGGSFHDIVNKQVQAEPTEVLAGEFWSFITSKPALLTQLKSAKLGQVIGLRFAEEKPAKKKGFNDSKIIKVYLGDMDPDYHGENSLEV